MTRSLSPAENYIVCVRVDRSANTVPGSVKEKCFACSEYVVLYPDSQRLIQERPEEHIKVVCSSCYMSAPDKDHIRSSERSLPRDILESIKRSQ